jgi:ABC-2 type transport system ATP-binding protein
MNDPIIKLENLTKVFDVQVKEGEGILSSLKQLVRGKHRIINAVNNVNMEINKGEIRGLIGPNGAGKSTIIKMISGILFPTSGSIKVMGYSPWRQRKEYVRNIGVLLGQKTQLLWDLPAIDTFQLNKVIYKIPDKRLKDNINYFKEILQLDDILNVPVRNLSLGERIKCEIACALMHDPRLVFLDEPTIGLDIFAKEGIRNFIKKINREKDVTFILTTHDLAEIENLCDNVTVINKGIVVYNDSLNNLKRYYDDKKYIEIIFSEEVSEESMSAYNVISSTPFSAKIEVNLKVVSLREEINRIFRELPVRDITIVNPDIEKIIREIYCI